MVMEKTRAFITEVNIMNNLKLYKVLILWYNANYLSQVQLKMKIKRAVFSNKRNWRYDLNTEELY